MNSTAGQFSAAASREARKQHRESWLIVLGIGFVIIIIGNLLGLGPWWLAIAVSVAMGGFAYSVRDVDVSGDAKGDSIYYLGLLFTFVALVAALIAFDWEISDAAGSSTSGAIRNFGIALLTTIVGLAGRVWFSMSQESPGDIAHTAKSALEEAVSAMKGSLDRARDDLDTLAGKFRESTKDLGKTTATIAASAKKAAETSESLDKCSAEVAGAAKDFTREMGDFRTAMGAGADAAASLKRSLGGIGDQTKVFGTRFETLSEQIEQIHSAFARINGVAGPSADAIAATSQGVAHAAAEASSLGRTLAGLRHSAGKARKAFDGVADSVDATRVVPALEEAAAQVAEGGRHFRSVGVQAAATDGELAGLGESARNAKDSIASVSDTARSIREHMDGARNDLSSSVSTVQKHTRGLNADLDAMEDQSVKLSGALARVERQAQRLSEDIRQARASGVPGSLAVSPFTWIARAFRRVARGRSQADPTSRRRR